MKNMAIYDDTKMKNANLFEQVTGKKSRNDSFSLEDFSLFDEITSGEIDGFLETSDTLGDCSIDFAPFDFAKFRPTKSVELVRETTKPKPEPKLKLAPTASLFQLAIPTIIKPILVDEGLNCQQFYEKANKKEAGEVTPPPTAAPPEPKANVKAFDEHDLEHDDYLLVSTIMEMDSLPAAPAMGSSGESTSSDGESTAATPAARPPAVCLHAGGGAQPPAAPCARCELARQKTRRRAAAIRRWRAKRARRTWGVVHYRGRARVAAARPRRGGRFVRQEDNFVPVTQM
mmetsp:Transcript_40643/g.71023  ORF Transcript_40643/g.71023 Transcript_40643/m.71023 type:complete len:287 (-) Transcript_40643:251-1111(-)